MARKTLTITIDASGRDKGKIFVLTEMPASQAERWALRALSALAGSGVEVPDDLKDAGFAGLARLGIQAFGNLPWEKAEPLLDEMFRCVQCQPSPKVVRDLVEDDIEEIATRLKLRMELFKLHADFLQAGVQS